MSKTIRSPDDLRNRPSKPPTFGTMLTEPEMRELIKHVRPAAHKNPFLLNCLDKLSQVHQTAKVILGIK